MQFLIEGAKQGKKGLMVTLDEHPAQICRNADSMNLEFKKLVEDEKLFIHYDSPLELELDVHFHEIKNIIEQENIERVVIDSLAAYESADPQEARDFIYGLTTFLKNKLITTYFNYESPEMLGISQISKELKASTIVDNIVLLNYVEVSTKMRRAITVPKVRGSQPTQRTREFIIDKGGIFMIDESSGGADAIEKVPQLPFSSYYGVLSRAPVRNSPVIENRIASGEGLPPPVTLKVEPNGSAHKPKAKSKKAGKYAEEATI
jgi:circadian clock protein KaiC